MKILLSGVAGFIGFHLARRLAQDGHSILSVDNINNYYDIELKYRRLSDIGIERNDIIISDKNNILISSVYPNLKFIKIDLCDTQDTLSLFRDGAFDVVIHLAAQAGVRYSLSNPHAYISSNIIGFLNILEAVKVYPAHHLVYASSSSVYGLNSKIPFNENDDVNKPSSLYASTKRSNELMAYTYSHLYHIPVTGLRFFTVYGPWGRPDMSPFIFTKSIIENKPINLFNNGNMKRDFTYIDDVIEGITRVINHIPAGDNDVPSSLYNIGAGKPVELMDFIHTLEKKLNKKALINYSPMQPGDVIATCADCSALKRDTGFSPQTSLTDGIQNFISWYEKYYN